MEDAITREIKEETNLTVNILHPIRVRGFTKDALHLVGITYLASCEKVDDMQISEEHTDFFWKTKEEILQGTFPERLKEEVSYWLDFSL